MRYAALLTLLLANAAWANGLDDLRAGLSTLQGQGTLLGTFEAKQSERDLDGKKPPQSAHASAQVEEDAGALQIRWDRATLKRAADEASPPNGAKRNEALSTLVGTSSALRIANLVNYAPAFLRALDGAQLKSERADIYQGKPVRLLELTLVERAPEEEQIKMKESTHIAHVWLSADNVPLAASITHRRRAKVMVFLSFEQQAREDFVFSVVANRLVVLKRDEQGTAKGFGSDTQYHNTYSFAPKA